MNLTENEDEEEEEEDEEKEEQFGQIEASHFGALIKRAFSWSCWYE